MSSAANQKIFVFTISAHLNNMVELAMVESIKYLYSKKINYKVYLVDDNNLTQYFFDKKNTTLML